MRTSDIGDSIHDKTFFLFVFVAISIVMLLLWGTPILFIAISIVIILYFNAIPLGERRSYSKPQSIEERRVELRGSLGTRAGQRAAGWGAGESCLRGSGPGGCSLDLGVFGRRIRRGMKKLSSCSCHRNCSFDNISSKSMMLVYFAELCGTLRDFAGACWNLEIL